MKTPLLTLDIAKSATGFALWTPGSPPRYGAERFGQYADLGALLCAYSAWLGDLMRVGGVKTVVYEAPYIRHDRGHQTAVALLNMAGTTDQVCGSRRVACYSENVNRVRKHFCGHGNLGRHKAKAAVIAACSARGWRPEDDNAADALALLDYMAHLWRLPADWPCGALFKETA